MRDLLVVVPSRGRPQNIARLAKAMAATCKGDTHLLVGLDADDPTRAEYPELLGVEYVVQDGLRQVVRWLNELSVPNTSHYRFIGTLGDDNVPLTDGWDVRVIESLERNLFCYADDLYPGRETGTLCCHVFMRSEVIQALGYMAAPAFLHMYCDPAWLALGEATSIEFMADVLIEHRHYSAGKSDWDETYAASHATTQHDLEAFNEYMRTDFNTDVEKLRGIPFTEAQRAEFNARLNIPG